MEREGENLENCEFDEIEKKRARKNVKLGKGGTIKVSFEKVEKKAREKLDLMRNWGKEVKKLKKYQKNEEKWGKYRKNKILQALIFKIGRNEP
jgi:hypothetical protein